MTSTRRASPRTRLGFISRSVSRVAQHDLDSLAALEAKLAQFQRGTTFVVRLIQRRGMSVVEERGTHAQ
jgi:hypothetical protein